MKKFLCLTRLHGSRLLNSNKIRIDKTTKSCQRLITKEMKKYSTFHKANWDAHFRAIWKRCGFPQQYIRGLNHNQYMVSDYVCLDCGTCFKYVDKTIEFIKEEVRLYVKSLEIDRSNKIIAEKIYDERCQK